MVYVHKKVIHEKGNASFMNVGSCLWVLSTIYCVCERSKEFAELFTSAVFVNTMFFVGVLDAE